MNEFYQQGDVILEAVGEMPLGNPVATEQGHFILARGEATGHAHRIESIAGVEFIEKDGMFYIHNAKPVMVRHEEHKPIIIPAGIWRVRGVREYDHFAEEARRVAD